MSDFRNSFADFAVVQEAAGEHPPMPHRGSPRVISRYVASAFGIAIGCLYPTAIQAQSNEPPAASNNPPDGQATARPQLQEIIVTAEKRSTNLQRTPLAVTALSSATLAQHQVRQLEDIQALVPNFKMEDTQGIAQITLRGIGNAAFQPGAEGAAAVNLNGVYISRGVAQLSGLYDISGIEVLRGPQGTLYGRNATAGGVNISTTQPTDEWSGYGRVTVGNYGALRVEGAVGGPVLDDKILIRIAGFRETRDGYGTNIATDTPIDNKNEYGVRGTIIIKPTSHLKATIIAEYFHENDHGAGFHYFGAGGLAGPASEGFLDVRPLFEQFGGSAPTNIRDEASGKDPLFQLRTTAITADLDWSNGGPISLKSITGYRSQRANALYDLDGGVPLNVYYLQGEPARQLSEELQAHYDSSRIHVTAGLYYFHERDVASPASVIASTASITKLLGIVYPVPAFVDLVQENGTLYTRSGAAFLQATYNLTDKLSLTAGVRYSAETKRLDQQFGFTPFNFYAGSIVLSPVAKVPSVTFHSTTPKVGIQYQIDSRSLIYASYSKGFKSGGFDEGVADPAPYSPEKLTDYEVGLKTTQLDNRLRANLSAFYYDYSNLQVEEVNGLSVETSNAANAHDYGVEAELTLLITRALKIDANAAWTHARYVKYIGPDPARPGLANADFSGNALDNAPNYQATVSAQYTWDLPKGSLSARGEVEYSSRFFFAANNFRELSQGAFVKGNFYLTYDFNKNWELLAYIKNVANVTTKTAALVASPLIGNPVLGSLAPPRTFGATVQYKF